MEGAAESCLTGKLTIHREVENAPTGTEPAHQLAKGPLQLPLPDVSGKAAVGREEPIDRCAGPPRASADEPGRERG